jgi:hypothetical protein
VNLSRANRDLGREEGALPEKCEWYGAPLSPVFGDRLEGPDVLTCLTELLVNMRSFPVSLRSISCESTSDGVSVEFKYDELATPARMRNRYVEHSGDESDGWFFGDRKELDKWMITVQYRLSEPQSDRRRHVVEVPGEVVARLARRVLGDDI